MYFGINKLSSQPITVSSVTDKYLMIGVFDSDNQERNTGRAKLNRQHLISPSVNV